MAKAVPGGAAAIRAMVGKISGYTEEVQVPIIGPRKRDYPNSPVFITPTLIEVEEAGSRLMLWRLTYLTQGPTAEPKDFIAPSGAVVNLIMADVSNPDEGAGS